MHALTGHTCVAWGPGPWGRCVAEDEHLGTRWCTEPDAPKVACISFIRPSFFSTFFGTLTPALNPAPPLPFNHKRTELPRARSDTSVHSTRDAPGGAARARGLLNCRHGVV